MCVGVTVEELRSESSFAGFLYAPPTSEQWYSRADFTPSSPN